MGRRFCGRKTVQCATCRQHRKEHAPGGAASTCTFVAKLCARAPIKGRDCCQKHGGKSLVGPANPAYKTGKHSQLLSENLARRYMDALQNPRLVSLRDEVALVSVRVGQLVEDVGKTGSAALWKEVGAALAKLKLAGKGKVAVTEARVALQQLEDLHARGMQDAATWEELRETLELQRRLTESEFKREKDLRQLVPLADVIALMGVLVAEVNRRVDDREVLAALSATCLRLIGRGDRPETET